MLYWITGRKHSGKTTLAKKIAVQLTNAIVLDGDEIRRYFPDDFSAEGRVRNQERLALIAHLVEDQGFTPIIACVSPVLEVRKRLQATFKECLEIQLPFGTLWEGSTYEETA